MSQSRQIVQKMYGTLDYLMVKIKFLNSKSFPVEPNPNSTRSSWVGPVQLDKPWMTYSVKIDSSCIFSLFVPKRDMSPRPSQFIYN